jgi:hypothetical protein
MKHKAILAALLIAVAYLAWQESAEAGPLIVTNITQVSLRPTTSSTTHGQSGFTHLCPVQQVLEETR